MSTINTRIHTDTNRYPLLFGNIYLLRKLYFGNNIKVLSFGCSTGEEMLSLSDYFDTDYIYGCDINTDAIKTAEQRVSFSPNLHVFYSNDANLEKYGPYDIIFANSVLCINTTKSTQLKENFSFHQFENIITKLARLLTPNGLIAIYNTSYFPDHCDSFIDIVSPIRSHFITPGYVPRFDKDSNLILSRVSINGTGYYKLHGTNNYSFEDYYNVIYTRSPLISKFKLDYSEYPYCDEHRHQIDLLRDVYMKTSDILIEKVFTHFDNNNGNIPTNISKTNKDDVGQHFLFQVCCRIPGDARGFVPLSDY